MQTHICIRIPTKTLHSSTNSSCCSSSIILFFLSKENKVIYLIVMFCLFILFHIKEYIYIYIIRNFRDAHHRCDYFISNNCVIINLCSLWEFTSICYFWRDLFNLFFFFNMLDVKRRVVMNWNFYWFIVIKDNIHLSNKNYWFDKKI
jgi:hypothetical protein